MYLHLQSPKYDLLSGSQLNVDDNVKVQYRLRAHGFRLPQNKEIGAGSPIRAWSDAYAG
jgi:hypothetical protein